MRTSKKDSLKTHLRPGGVYRRSDVEKFSRSVDRDLAQLVEEGTLVKVRQGLYRCPERSRFGVLPARADKLVKTFLKEDDFLLTSPNDYNFLGVGTTQLYNHYVVYNHKRHGTFELDGQTFEFHKTPRFPKKLTAEFLLIELLNNLEQIAEDRNAVMERVKEKAQEMNARVLQSAVKRFSKVSTRKFLEDVFCEQS